MEDVGGSIPILNRRHNFQKVFRPNGMLYADGRGATPELAVAAAMVAFQAEFGRPVNQEFAVIEIVGVTALWVANVMEIHE